MVVSRSSLYRCRCVPSTYRISEVQIKLSICTRGSNWLGISEFLGFLWQSGRLVAEILSLLQKVLLSETEAVIMTTSPLYNICKCSYLIFSLKKNTLYFHSRLKVLSVRTFCWKMRFPSSIKIIIMWMYFRVTTVWSPALPLLNTMQAPWLPPPNTSQEGPSTCTELSPQIWRLLYFFEMPYSFPRGRLKLFAPGLNILRSILVDL